MVCEPPTLRPTYLPWVENAGTIPAPIEVRSGTQDSPNASATWAADPDAYRSDDPDGDLSYVSVAVLHEYDRAGTEFPQVEVLGRPAELVWVGDPGIGALAAIWREAPGPCGIHSVSLRIWGSPPYLDGAPDAETYEQAEGDEVDRLMGAYEQAVAREIVLIANSLQQPQDLTRLLNEDLARFIEQAGLTPRGGDHDFMNASNTVEPERGQFVSLFIYPLESADLGDVSFEQTDETDVGTTTVALGRRSDGQAAARFTCGDFQFQFFGEDEVSVDEVALALAAVVPCPYEPSTSTRP